MTLTRFRDGQEIDNVMDEVQLVNGLTDPLVKLMPKTPDLRDGDYIELAWNILYNDGEQTSITREMFNYGGFGELYPRR